ncbi:TPA: hypothetical protein JGU28_004490 [Salmonella enterica]|nr:hypothetical protein [Salmonella enterica]
MSDDKNSFRLRVTGGQKRFPHTQKLGLKKINQAWSLRQDFLKTINVLSDKAKKKGASKWLEAADRASIAVTYYQEGVNFLIVSLNFLNHKESLYKYRSKIRPS